MAKSLVRSINMTSVMPSAKAAASRATSEAKKCWVINQNKGLNNGKGSEL